MSIRLDEMKQRINQGAREYAKLDSIADQAARRTLYWNLYVDISVYVDDVYKPMKIEKSFEQSADVDDVRDLCIEKAVKLLDQYDPKHSGGAAFMTYLNGCLQNCLIDFKRKLNTRNNVIDKKSVDEMMTAASQDGEAQNLIEKNSGYQTTDKHLFEENEERLLILQQYADYIIGFMEHRGKKNSDIKKLYYQVFYSESLINCIWEETGDDEECYPSHILDAFLFRFSDYILMEPCRTINEICHACIHTYDDILHNGNEEPIKLPLPGKVLISYFADVENKKVSDANISQYRKSYKECLKNLFEFDV